MFKVLIVDDERLARVELKRLLKSFDDVNVVDEAKNAKQALTLIDEHKPDLVFLDIQMPEMTGLEVAEVISGQTKFVFCTAFNEHAVDAFSLNAVDYLVKPVNPERLSLTIEKLRKALKQSPEESEDSTSQDNTTYLPDNHGLLLKFGDSSKIIRLSEIERFESIGNHVAVYTAAGKSYIHSSLSKVEKRLDPSTFFKASRSDIVRVDSISSIEDGISAGSMVAVLNSGQQIEVSRRQSQALKQLFNVW